MPIAGGESDKLGNRYEGKWTVYCMIDVMKEKANSIRLEKPGEDAFEFFLKKKEHLECHQVKRQRSGRGRWTISSLEDQQTKVLSDFRETIKDSDTTCVFVSTQDADELKELANRARDAISWEEYKQHYLNKTLSGNLDKLCKKWDNCSEVEAYKTLKQISIETIGEDILVNTIETFLEALVEADPKIIRLELANLALERIHQELTTHDIWQYLLQERKYRRREWNKDPHILATVDKVNDLYFSRFDNEKIADQVISRDEVSLVLEKLTSPSDKCGVLITGEAGVGKSGIIGQVTAALREQGLPLLAFRIDRLDPTQSPDNLGQQLEELPGSPANVLAVISQERECVLIIDQLDAVSEASGRNPWFFECVDKIIKQAQQYPNIHILLACRKFDLDNDFRIRRLVGKDGILETVPVSRLTHDKIKEICSNLGLDTIQLTPKQLDLLSLPLHLWLLTEITNNLEINALNFSTAKDLYDAFWKDKRCRVKERLNHSPQWTKVIDVLCDYMSERQSLSAPQEIVDDYEEDARVMASEHILTWQNERISFFHEGFFDYAFARRFATRGQKLLPFLQSSKQHLFCRSQVRQILFHERDADFECYLIDLHKLLTSNSIRFHIKRVVLALLADLNDPREEEWKILESLISPASSSISDQIWQILHSSPNWFQLLDSLGIITSWLHSRDVDRIDKTITFISRIQKQLPDRVAKLLEPHINSSDAWQHRLAFIMQWADIGAGRRFFELFLRLVDDGTLDDVKAPVASNSEFWNLIYSLPQQHPDWACEVIGHYLNRRLSLSLANGQLNPFDRKEGTIPNSQFDTEIFIESAKNAPKEFIENILPFFLRVIELTANQDTKPPWRDSIWSCRAYGMSYESDQLVLESLETALCKLAVNQFRDFIVVKQQLRQSNFETIGYLLIKSYTAIAEKSPEILISWYIVYKKFHKNNANISTQLKLYFLAIACDSIYLQYEMFNESIDYLCENSARFQTSYMVSLESSYAHYFWVSRQLLKAVTPYCSSERITVLENNLLNYYPTWEKDYNFRYLHSFAQFVLLSAIPDFRRTSKVTNRCQELKRKFISLNLIEKSGEIEPPSIIEAGPIGPPIPEPASEKMTDRQWLEAIISYNYNDAISRFEQTGELIGGAYQLSSLLQKEVAKNPFRFAELVQQFPENTNPYYFNAVLRGIAESEISIDLQIIRKVLQHCHQLPKSSCGRSISELFQKLANLPWISSDLDILVNYALHDPNPEQEYWRTPTAGGDVYCGGDIFTCGINSTRGSAVSAITRLIFADKERTLYFLPHCREKAPVIISDLTVR